MQNNLHDLDLESVRGLFLKETREFLAASQYESPAELKKRKERIKEIEKLLEEKKKLIQIATYKNGF